MKLRYGVTLFALLFAVSTAGAQNFTATLDGAQEVPSVPTPATGSATMNLDAAKMLHFNITYSGLVGSETAAHFHGAAAPGSNAGVRYGLPAGQPKNGMVGPLTASQEAELNAGLWYINIHTTFRTGGEIRGQVLPEAVPTESATWSRIKALLR